jgi:transposase
MDDTKNVFFRIGYKYEVNVALVSAKYTSQECSHCHRINKENRDGAYYSCECGFTGNSDLNAAINIRDRMTNPAKREKLQYIKNTKEVRFWTGKEFRNQKSYEVA